MRKVKRTDIPLSLKNNADKWTAELLEEISKKGGFSKVSK